MSAKEYKSTISVRIPVEVLKKLDAEVTSKVYRDRTEAILSRIQNSYHLDSLMAIAKDPKLQNEMNTKIKQMVGNSSVEQTLETMSIGQRNAIVFYAKHLNEKQLTQSQIGV